MVLDEFEEEYLSLYQDFWLLMTNFGPFSVWAQFETYHRKL